MLIGAAAGSQKENASLKFVKYSSSVKILVNSLNAIFRIHHHFAVESNIKIRKISHVILWYHFTMRALCPMVLDKSHLGKSSQDFQTNILKSLIAFALFDWVILSFLINSRSNVRILGKEDKGNRRIIKIKSPLKRDSKSIEGVILLDKNFNSFLTHYDINGRIGSRDQRLR